MNILCVGGAGKICRESVKDLVKYSNFDKITIADINPEEAEKLVGEIGDTRVGFTKFDLTDTHKAIDTMKEYSLVMASLPIKYDDLLVDCVVNAGVSGLDITGMGKAYFDYHSRAHKSGIVFVPGVGMTPGTTNILAMYAAAQMDRVDEIFISHGAFRALAHSPGLASTTFLEYDPDLPDRVIYENGRYIQVPPFSGEKIIKLPDPFGEHPQYIIPHPEAFTLPNYIKGVKRIEVRGTWPPKNMALVKSLYQYGFLRNDEVDINGTKVGIRDAVAAYLEQSPEGKQQDVWGYALHVELTGIRNGKAVRHVLTTSHPTSESHGWQGSRAYTRSVGIPLSIGAQMIAENRVKSTGVLAPEGAFYPLEYIKELAKRNIIVNEEINERHTII
ncbi:MAG: saccharopine dehydrogenase family protein [Spirochaetota bacterium]